MAENEKDVPIKEREDGTVLAKVDVPEGFDDEEESVEVPVDEQTAEEIAEDNQEAEDDGDPERSAVKRDVVEH